MVINAAGGGSGRFACATIGKSTSAMFEGSIIPLKLVSIVEPKTGEFVQVSIQKIFSSTTVYSKDHDYHVHMDGIPSGIAYDNAECQAAKGHYDPTGEEKRPGYLCSPIKPYECAAGDLSGKFGRINFGFNPAIALDQQPAYKTVDGGVSTHAFFSDDKSLTAGAIENRSIVIHAANRGKNRIACSDTLSDVFVYSPTPSPTPAPEDDDSLTTGAVVGITVGGLAVIAALIAIIVVPSIRGSLFGGESGGAHTKRGRNVELKDANYSDAPNDSHFQL